MRLGHFWCPFSGPHRGRKPAARLEGFLDPFWPLFKKKESLIRGLRKTKIYQENPRGRVRQLLRYASVFCSLADDL